MDLKIDESVILNVQAIQDALKGAEPPPATEPGPPAPRECLGRRRECLGRRRRECLGRRRRECLGRRRRRRECLGRRRRRRECLAAASAWAAAAAGDRSAGSASTSRAPGRGACGCLWGDRSAGAARRRPRTEDFAAFSAPTVMMKASDLEQQLAAQAGEAPHARLGRRRSRSRSIVLRSRSSRTPASTSRSLPGGRPAGELAVLGGGARAA